MAKARRSFLDGIFARLIALGVAVACGAALFYLSRDSLLPPQPERTVSADPLAGCIARRTAEIDGMVEEGLIDEAEAEVFKARLEGVCQAEVGSGAAAQ